MQAECYDVERMVRLECAVCKLGNFKEMLKLHCICLNVVEGKWLAERSGYKLNSVKNGDFWMWLVEAEICKSCILFLVGTGVLVYEV